MRAVLLYPILVLKYLLVSTVVSGAIWYFYPTVGLIIGALLMLGSLGAAADESRKTAQLAHDKRALRVLQVELDGFNEAARSTARKLG